MKIDFDKNVVKLTPEDTVEATKLNAIWRVLIDCNHTSRNMTPIGEYLPEGDKNHASFVIENYDSPGYFEVPVLEECKVYCDVCNDIISLKAGDMIPLCCNKLMEIVD